MLETVVLANDELTFRSLSDSQVLSAQGPENTCSRTTVPDYVNWFKLCMDDGKTRSDIVHGVDMGAQVRQ